MNSPTDFQMRVYRMHKADGISLREIARRLDKSDTTVRRAYHRAIANGAGLSEGAKASIETAGLSAVEARGGWIHNYDSDGKKVGTTFWKAPEIEAYAQTLAERLQDAFSDLPTAPVRAIETPTEAELLTLYPIADLHAGMMAWGEETGEDYDTKAATQRLFFWLARCVDVSPASDTAVILLAGDTFHSDDQTNQTPRSRHVLDADTRQFKTLDMTIAAVAGATEYAARKHKRVVVVVLPGNHDPHAYMTALFALDQRYREHDRIEVRKKPGEWWVHQFGKVMLSAHHGDKAKAQRMAHFLADDYAPIWGRTKYRYLWTGHLHHHKSEDIGGLQWEQLRAVTSRDAYAVSHAYSARAQMQAITYHRERGEIQRFKVGQ